MTLNIMKVMITTLGIMSLIVTLGYIRQNIFTPVSIDLLNVIMPNAIIANVVMPSAVAPLKGWPRRLEGLFLFSFYFIFNFIQFYF